MRMHCAKQIAFAGQPTLCLAVMFCLGTAYGQSGPPSGAAGSPSSIPANATRIETEVVVVTNSAAVPNQIKRKPGKFFLLLKSKSGSALPAVFFDSPGFAATQVSSLTQDFNSALFQRLNHGAMLLDLPTGEIDLKSRATGKVLLKITIQ
jgi:hypothetical protein